MTLEQMVNMFTTNGMSLVIIAYFLYKDYKFNDQILKVLGEAKTVLVELRTFIQGGASE